jgi:hypothetical protein
MQACDDASRRVARKQQARPRIGYDVFIAELHEGRDTRQQLRALVAAHCQRAQPSAVQKLLNGRNPGEGHLHLACKEIGHCGAGSLIRNVQDVDACTFLQKLHRQVVDGSLARGRIVERARLRLGERYELPDVFRRQRRMHDEDQRRHGHQRHRGEVLDRIIGEVARQVGGDRARPRIALQNRVSVRRCARDDFGGERAARAAAIIHDHLVAEALRQLLRDDAPDDVVGAAHREWNQKADGLGWIVGFSLRRGRINRRQGQHSPQGYRPPPALMPAAEPDWSSCNALKFMLVHTLSRSLGVGVV